MNWHSWSPALSPWLAVSLAVNKATSSWPEDQSGGAGLDSSLTCSHLCFYLRPSPQLELGRGGWWCQCCPVPLCDWGQALTHYWQLYLLE